MKRFLCACITRRSAYLIKHSFFCWKARQPCCWTDAVTSTTTTTTTIATTTLHIQLQFCSHRNVNPPTQPNPTPDPDSRFLQFHQPTKRSSSCRGLNGSWRVPGPGRGDDADNPQILFRRIRNGMAYARIKIC